MSITADAANVQVPPRPRTFTQEDAANVLALFKGEANGQDGTPAENVGFGEFDTPASARSAGTTLNRLLAGMGAPHKYAVTTFERNGKTVGVLLNKKAKERAAATETPATSAAASTGASASRGRSGRSK
jgi:hypothetical protein